MFFLLMVLEELFASLVRQHSISLVSIYSRRALGRISLPFVPSTEIRRRVSAAAAALHIMMQECFFLAVCFCAEVSSHSPEGGQCWGFGTCLVYILPWSPLCAQASCVGHTHGNSQAVRCYCEMSHR